MPRRCSNGNGCQKTTNPSKLLPAVGVEKSKSDSSKGQKMYEEIPVILGKVKEEKLTKEEAEAQKIELSVNGFENNRETPPVTVKIEPKTVEKLDNITTVNSPYFSAPPPNLSDGSLFLNVDGQSEEDSVLETFDPVTGIWIQAPRPEDLELDPDSFVRGHNYTFRWRVVNKPGTPEAVSWSSSHVSLKWKPPTSGDGKHIMVQGYAIEQKDAFDSKWKTVVMSFGPGCEASVCGLTKGRSYWFRVLAKTETGLSNRSDAVGPITAMDKLMAPKIDRTNLQDVTLPAGSLLAFDVNITGEEPPNTVWTLNGNPLEASPTISLDNVDHNSKLALRPSVNESGQYTITATNASGVDCATVNVTVTENPFVLFGPFQQHSNESGSRWQLVSTPSDNGGAQVRVDKWN